MTYIRVCDTLVQQECSVVRGAISLVKINNIYIIFISYHYEILSYAIKIKNVRKRKIKKMSRKNWVHRAPNGDTL